jgi:hypothetical protein
LGRHDRLGGGADGRWVVVVAGSGGLLGVLALLEVDLVAERFELALESAGAMFGRIALALPVGSELSERDLVADDVVVGDQEVVTDRADRLGLTAPSAELREVGGEIGAPWFGRRLEPPRVRWRRLLLS